METHRQPNYVTLINWRATTIGEIWIFILLRQTEHQLQHLYDAVYGMTVKYLMQLMWIIILYNPVLEQLHENYEIMINVK